MSLRPCPAHTCQVSTCPRAKRPCTRARLPVFSMSLRTSAHTGAAIRVPAGKLYKLVILRANSQHFSDSPKVLLSVMPCRKEYGLPRRFAPRNDMLKFAACPHNTWALPVYCRKASLQLLTRHRLLRVQGQARCRAKSGKAAKHCGPGKLPGPRGWIYAFRYDGLDQPARFTSRCTVAANWARVAVD